MTDPSTADPARFGFGENWRQFLEVIDEARIVEAEQALEHMLGTSSLAGRTFLDVGCGSGLFSLAAARLGAARVHSFDYDVNSVRCAEELRRRFAPDAPWNIEQGSALDRSYLTSLGRWDIVYSWGVLHHTGDMWAGLENVVSLVAPSGQLFISIYNDQGLRSKLWTIEKRWYVAYPALRPLLVGGFSLVFGAYAAGRDILRLQPPWRRYSRPPGRGMSWYHDMVDWLGGYPFEVAKPAEITDYYKARGFALVQFQSVGGKLGCNEFVFRQTSLRDVSA